jgi:hypothetical protein
MNHQRDINTDSHRSLNHQQTMVKSYLKYALQVSSRTSCMRSSPNNSRAARLSRYASVPTPINKQRHSTLTTTVPTHNQHEQHSFGVVASSTSNVLSHGNGKFAITAAVEEVLVWNVKQGGTFLQLWTI